MMGPGRPANECENIELIQEFESACRARDYEFAEEYREELLKRLNTPPVPTIKPGDKVRHVGTGTAGKVAQVTEVGAFVHWSTGQRSWYPFSYLEVVE